MGHPLVHREGSLVTRSFVPPVRRFPSLLSLTLVAIGLAGLTAAGRADAQKPTRTPAATQPPAVPTIWSGDKPPIGLTGGAASVDELLDRFLATVRAGDLKALQGLRLTKEEYTSIVVPGEVPKGQPPRQTFEKVNDVFFGMLDTRSQYAAQAIVGAFKDKDFVRREVRMTEPRREFAWYTAIGEVRIILTQADGQQSELRTGWIAEVDGQYKFIGFNWDD